MMNTALKFRRLPLCPRCGVAAAPELLYGDAFSYKDAIRLHCDACGAATQWHPFEKYNTSIPACWEVLDAAIGEFAAGGMVNGSKQDQQN